MQRNLKSTTTQRVARSSCFGENKYLIGNNLLNGSVTIKYYNIVIILIKKQSAYTCIWRLMCADRRRHLRHRWRTRPTNRSCRRRRRRRRSRSWPVAGHSTAAGDSFCRCPPTGTGRPPWSRVAGVWSADCATGRLRPSSGHDHSPTKSRCERPSISSAATPGPGTRHTATVTTVGTRLSVWYAPDICGTPPDDRTATSASSPSNWRISRTAETTNVYYNNYYQLLQIINCIMCRKNTMR